MSGELKTRKAVRSKRTGRFLKSKAVKHRPDVAECTDLPLPRKVVTLYRSLLTGRFVRKSTWKRNPGKYERVEILR